MTLSTMLYEMFAVNWAFIMDKIDAYNEEHDGELYTGTPEQIEAVAGHPMATSVFLAATAARQWYNRGQIIVSTDATLQRLLAVTPTGPLEAEDLQSPWGYHATWFDPGFSFQKKDHTQVLRAAIMGTDRFGKPLGILVGEDTHNLPNVIMDLQDIESIPLHVQPGKEEAGIAILRAWRVAVGLNRLIRAHKSSPSDALGGIVKVEDKGVSKKKGSHSIYVRRLFIVDPRVSDACRAALSSGAREPCLRHLVRGHWRNQACGEKQKERKLIWIQPFWRGELRELLAPKIVKVV